jgi:hypothetical protein
MFLHLMSPIRFLPNQTNRKVLDILTQTKKDPHDGKDGCDANPCAASGAVLASGLKIIPKGNTEKQKRKRNEDESNVSACHHGIFLTRATLVQAEDTDIPNQPTSQSEDASFKPASILELRFRNDLPACFRIRAFLRDLLPGFIPF